MKDYMVKCLVLLMALLASISAASLAYSQEAHTIRHPKTKEELKLYPNTYDHFPDLSSPYTSEDGTEIVVAFTQDEKYVLIPVTVENGGPLHYSRRIQSLFDISVRRELSLKEESFLKDRYSHLSTQKMADLEEKLSSIHFSEMAPYYIMRYGFYEGHTSYRADPIAIAFIFGLRSLDEIESVFKGKLYETLTNHFSEENVGKFGTEMTLN